MSHKFGCWKSSYLKAKPRHYKNMCNEDFGPEIISNEIAKPRLDQFFLSPKEEDYSYYCDMCHNTLKNSDDKNITECQEIEKKCADPDDDIANFCKELCNRCSNFDYCSTGLENYIIAIIVIAVFVVFLIFFFLIIYCCPCCAAVLLCLCCCCNVKNSRAQIE
jgi:hypothetical protein